MKTNVPYSLGLLVSLLVNGLNGTRKVADKFGDHGMGSLVSTKMTFISTSRKEKKMRHHGGWGRHGGSRHHHHGYGGMGIGLGLGLGAALGVGAGAAFAPRRSVIVTTPVLTPPIIVTPAASRVAAAEEIIICGNCQSQLRVAPSGTMVRCGVCNAILSVHPSAPASVNVCAAQQQLLQQQQQLIQQQQQQIEMERKQLAAQQAALAELEARQQTQQPFLFMPTQSIQPSPPPPFNPAVTGNNQ